MHVMASHLPSFERVPCPCVQLRHELPDGSSHVDWMLAGDPDARSSLVTFRIAQPLADLERGSSITAERLPDHRPIYLDYEGELSEGRGRVQQICRGELLAADVLDTASACVQIRWQLQSGGDLVQQLKLFHRSGDQWTVTSIDERCSVDQHVNSGL